MPRAFDEDESGSTIVETRVVNGDDRGARHDGDPDVRDRQGAGDGPFGAGRSPGGALGGQGHVHRRLALHGPSRSRLTAAEPNLDWVTAETASALANDDSVSMRVGNYSEINVARL
jgi:hypothetical protein